MHEPTRRSIATERELVPSPRMPHIFMASALWPAAQILQFAREATLGLDVSSGMVASALVLLSNSAADSTEAKATPFPHRLCAIDVPIFIAFAPFGQFNPPAFDRQNYREVTTLYKFISHICKMQPNDRVTVRRSHAHGGESYATHCHHAFVCRPCSIGLSVRRSWRSILLLCSGIDTASSRGMQSQWHGERGDRLHRRR